MGTAVSAVKSLVSKKSDKKGEITSKNAPLKSNRKKDFSDDIEDAANLAIAMETKNDTTNYMLTLACEDLPKMDAFSLTDAMAVVYMFEDGKWKLKGRTDVIWDNLAPRFSEFFTMPYNSKKEQPIKFIIYDVDDEAELDNQSKQEKIGTLKCTLKDIINDPNDLMIKPLTRPKKKKKKYVGNIIIKAVESDIGQSKIWLHFSIEDYIYKSKIMFSISGLNNNKQLKIYSSEHQQNAPPKGCAFDRFTINANQISDESANLKLEFFELKKSQAGQRLIGELDISQPMLENSRNKSISFHKNNIPIGKLKILELVRDKQDTFLNYIYPGFCLKTIMAVDFSKTKAKEDPAVFEEYAHAINTVGRQLNYYDDDYNAVSLGFGAKLKPYHNVVSHCFAMNMNYFKPTLTVEDCKERYYENQDKVQLHGPVIISEVIKFGADVARYIQKTNKKHYYVVLVIFTEGDIADKDIAFQEINNASDLPFSILMVGIGDGDFTILKQFDADNERKEPPLKSNTNKTASKKIMNKPLPRDIVQFIHYRKHKEDKLKLALEMFNEIPKQFLLYMSKNGIKTNKKEKTVSGIKITKKDFLAKFESRKTPNKLKVDIIKKMMEERRDNFRQKQLPLGYEKEIVDQILNKRIAAPDFKLMSEKIAKAQKKRDVIENQPIDIQDLRKVTTGLLRDIKTEQDQKLSYLDKYDDKWREIHKKTNLREFQINKILPKEEKIWTRDESPDPTSEWLSKNHKSYKISQEFLHKLERRIIDFQKEQLPPVLCGNNQKKKARKESISGVKTVTLDKSDQLIEVVNSELKKMNKYFGTETLVESMCLICRNFLINIIFMDCGHAITCASCADFLGTVCPLCKNKIDFRILSTPEEILMSKRSKEYTPKSSDSTNRKSITTNPQKIQLDSIKNLSPVKSLDNRGSLQNIYANSGNYFQSEKDNEINFDYYNNGKISDKKNFIEESICKSLEGIEKINTNQQKSKKKSLNSLAHKEINDNFFDPNLNSSRDFYQELMIPEKVYKSERMNIKHQSSIGFSDKIIEPTHENKQENSDHLPSIINNSYQNGNFKKKKNSVKSEVENDEKSENHCSIYGDQESNNTLENDYIKKIANNVAEDNNSLDKNIEIQSNLSIESIVMRSRKDFDYN